MQSLGSLVKPWLRGMEQDAVVIFGGRPSSMKMWSPDDIGRESWVWGEQETLEIVQSPHKVGEEALAEWIPSSAIKRSNP